MEGLHRNLIFATVLSFILCIFKGKIVFDGAARIFGLFVFAGSESRCKSPEGESDGETGEKTKEDSGFQASADFPRKVKGDEEEEGKEERIGKSLRSGSISWKRSVLYGRVLDNGSA
jgi:hypothetical protein